MRLSVLWLLLLLFGGCSITSMSLENGSEIVIRKDDKKLKVEGDLVQTRQERFSNLKLQQSVFKFDDGELCVYEEAETDVDYRFSTDTQSATGMIFDSRKVRTIASLGNLYFFQVLLKDNHWLNVIAEQGDIQKLQMIYGINNEKMKAAMEQMGGKPVMNLEEKVTSFDSFQGSFLTQWSAKLLILDGLVVRIRLNRMNL